MLLDLAFSPGPPRLIIRDGLLRTKALRTAMVSRLAGAFQEAHEKSGSLIVGVAKRSQVLNYLSLSLFLERTFDRPYPCFCEVPLEIERRAYRGHVWLTGSSFGKLHLAKLTADPQGLILPVDIPPWLADRRKEALEYLVGTAQTSFPIVGYPQPLVRAHDHAVMRGLEMSVLGDLLMSAVASGFSADQAERVVRHVCFGRSLLPGGASA